MYHIYIYASLLSIITCASVCLTYYVFTRAFPWRKSQSYLYGFRLVVVNGALGLVTILWDVADNLIGQDSKALHKLCRAYLPVPIYFFLCGFGFNILLALRFTADNAGALLLPNTNRLNTYIVWFTCFLLILPIAVMNMFDSLVVSDVVVTEFSDTGSMCLFNSTHLRSQIVNNICFQGPLCVTLLVNLFAYVRGVHGLKDAPQSVISREMRRAGVYTFTLLFLWIPNFVVNVLSEIYPEKQFRVAFELIIFVTSLQGFLNSAIFLWSYPKYRTWLRKKIYSSICVCFASPYDKYRNRSNRVLSDSSNSSRIYSPLIQHEFGDAGDASVLDIESTGLLVDMDSYARKHDKNYSHKEPSSGKPLVSCMRVGSRMHLKASPHSEYPVLAYALSPTTTTSTGGSVGSGGKGGSKFATPSNRNTSINIGDSDSIHSGSSNSLLFSGNHSDSVDVFDIPMYEAVYDTAGPGFEGKPDQKISNVDKVVRFYPKAELYYYDRDAGLDNELEEDSTASSHAISAHAIVDPCDANNASSSSNRSAIDTSIVDDSDVGAVAESSRFNGSRFSDISHLTLRDLECNGLSGDLDGDNCDTTPTATRISGSSSSIYNGNSSSSSTMKNAAKMPAHISLQMEPDDASHPSHYNADATITTTTTTTIPTSSSSGSASPDTTTSATSTAVEHYDDSESLLFPGNDAITFTNTLRNSASKHDGGLRKSRSYDSDEGSGSSGSGSSSNTKGNSSYKGTRHASSEGKSSGARRKYDHLVFKM